MGTVLCVRADDKTGIQLFPAYNEQIYLLDQYDTH